MFQENFISLLSFLVAVASAAVAFYSVSLSRNTAETSRRMTRQQAILAFLEDYKNDKRIHKALLYVSELEDKKGVYYVLLRCPTDMEAVNVLLNKYEILAVGLKHDFYDEKIFSETLAVEVIRVYERCKNLIVEMRENNAYETNDPSREAFSGFEALAKKYKTRFAKQQKCGIIAPMSGEITAKDATDHLIKHLEMIQGVVNRLAHCSFLIKGWSMTILAAVVVFLARSDIANPYILLAFYIPILGFAALDAYYLWQERLFRAVYNDVREWKVTNFSMPVPSQMGKPGCQYWSSLFSKTILLFYATQVAFLALVFFTLCI